MATTNLQPTITEPGTHFRYRPGVVILTCPPIRLEFGRSDCWQFEEHRSAPRKSRNTREPLARNPLRQLATYIGNDYHSARCIHPEMNPAREDSIEASVPIEKFLLSSHIVVYPT